MKIFALPLLAALTLTAACAPQDSSADMMGETASGVVIDMTPGLTFDAQTVTIAAGETVTFRNTSDFAHTVSTRPSNAAQEADTELPAGATSFDSGSIAAGGTFTQTFTVPGTYRYFCDPHHGAGMTGTIIVTAS